MDLDDDDDYQIEKNVYQIVSASGDTSQAFHKEGRWQWEQ